MDTPVDTGQLNDGEVEKVEVVGPPAEEDFLAPGWLKGKVQVVEATEIEIAAAIVILKARSVHFPRPPQVEAYPFSPAYGWRQAALEFIRQNKENAAKGRPIVI